MHQNKKPDYQLLYNLPYPIFDVTPEELVLLKLCLREYDKGLGTAGLCHVLKKIRASTGLTEVAALQHKLVRRVGASLHGWLQRDEEYNNFTYVVTLNFPHKLPAVRVYIRHIWLRKLILNYHKKHGYPKVQEK